MERQPGVSSPGDLKKFVADAGDKLLVIDLRDPTIHERTSDIAPVAGTFVDDNSDGAAVHRPRAINIVFDIDKNSLDLSRLPMEKIEAGGGKEHVHIITHCNGGGRGQKAKEILERAGFLNVRNGGGPEVTECWNIYGNL
jgi:rhodanese-related sulfurtransferase